MKTLVCRPSATSLNFGGSESSNRSLRSPLVCKVRGSLLAGGRRREGHASVCHMIVSRGVRKPIGPDNLTLGKQAKSTWGGGQRRIMWGSRVCVPPVLKCFPLRFQLGGGNNHHEFISLRRSRTTFKRKRKSIKTHEDKSYTSYT